MFQFNKRRDSSAKLFDKEGVERQDSKTVRYNHIGAGKDDCKSNVKLVEYRNANLIIFERSHKIAKVGMLPDTEMTMGVLQTVLNHNEKYNLCKCLCQIHKISLREFFDPTKVNLNFNILQINLPVFEIFLSESNKIKTVSAITNSSSATSISINLLGLKWHATFKPHPHGINTKEKVSSCDQFPKSEMTLDVKKYKPQHEETFQLVMYYQLELDYDLTKHHTTAQNIFINEKLNSNCDVFFGEGEQQRLDNVQGDQCQVTIFDIMKDEPKDVHEAVTYLEKLLKNVIVNKVK